MATEIRHSHKHKFKQTRLDFICMDSTGKGWHIQGCLYMYVDKTDDTLTTTTCAHGLMGLPLSS